MMQAKGHGRKNPGQTAGRHRHHKDRPIDRPIDRSSNRPRPGDVMRVSNVEFAATPEPAAPCHDPVRKLLESWPRPVRFLGVGGLGLITDLAIFTVLIAHTPHPLLVRLFSLALATLVTWRLNRALTFDRSGRHPADE